LIKNKLLIYLSIIVSIGIGGYFLLFNFQKSMMQGERLSGLDKIITQELSDSVKVGLERFKNHYNHYPNYIIAENILLIQ